MNHDGDGYGDSIMSRCFELKTLARRLMSFAPLRFELLDDFQRH